MTPAMAEMRTFFITLRALVYATSFVLFFGWLALWVRAWDSSLGVVWPAWTSLFGILLMVIGAGLVLLCVGVFSVPGRGTPAVFDPPREFVAGGPYHYVRNPLYRGGFSLLLGFGLYSQAVSMLIFALGVMLLIHVFVLLVEEPGLEQRFGLSRIQAIRESLDTQVDMSPRVGGLLRMEGRPTTASTRRFAARGSADARSSRGSRG
jgi:protein-S-isoprenylcysteine O-methyltransferase Ste14